MTRHKMTRHKMMPVKQFNMRIPEKWIVDAAELGKHIAPKGITFTTSDIFRMAIAEFLAKKHEKP